MVLAVGGVRVYVLIFVVGVIASFANAATLMRSTSDDTSSRLDIVSASTEDPEHLDPPMPAGPCGQHVDFPQFRGEFGFELMMAIPYAYALWQDGRLASTRGCGAMKAYYWFSPNHIDDDLCVRDKWVNQMSTCYGQTMSEGSLIKSIPAYWRPVPYLSHYFNLPALPSSKGFTTAPMQLAIFNKFEKEWDRDPVNYIPAATVAALVDTFRSTCGSTARVLYQRDIASANKAAPEVKGMAEDGGMTHQFHLDLRDSVTQELDVDHIRKQPHAEFLQDVAHENGQLSFNEVTLRALSRTKCFVGVQGGTSEPSFHFGGQHILLKKAGREPPEFYSVLAPKLSGQTITVVNSEQQLVQDFKNLMLRDGCKPCVLRTNL